MKECVYDLSVISLSTTKNTNKLKTTVAAANKAVDQAEIKVGTLKK